MEIKYKTHLRINGNYLTSKHKTNQLRTILKEEGFKRLFWSYPNSEMYSRKEIRAKITSSGLEINSYKLKNTETESEKSKVKMNKTLAKKIINWYQDN